MNLLINKADLVNYKSSDLLPLQCKQCNKTFYKTKKYIISVSKFRTIDCCSIQCNNKLKIIRTDLNLTCKKCGKSINKKYNKFCSSSCSAIYNNSKRIKKVNVKIKTNKYKFICIDNCGFCSKEISYSKVKKYLSTDKRFCSKKCRMTYYNKNSRLLNKNNRSKLEAFLEIELKNNYPNLNILFNDRITIGLELDIYFPSLKKAIEINGIHHYKPIWGIDKLNNTMKKDSDKLKSCNENNINLKIIDVSKVGSFNIKIGSYYFNEITKWLQESDSNG